MSLWNRDYVPDVFRLGPDSELPDRNVHIRSVLLKQLYRAQRRQILYALRFQSISIVPLQKPRSQAVLGYSWIVLLRLYHFTRQLYPFVFFALESVYVYHSAMDQNTNRVTVWRVRVCAINVSLENLGVLLLYILRSDYDFNLTFTKYLRCDSQSDINWVVILQVCTDKSHRTSRHYLVSFTLDGCWSKLALFTNLSPFMVLVASSTASLERISRLTHHLEGLSRRGLMIRFIRGDFLSFYFCLKYS